jgi:hypothetical protein
MSIMGWIFRWMELVSVHVQWLNFLVLLSGELDSWLFG